MPVADISQVVLAAPVAFGVGLIVGVFLSSFFKIRIVKRKPDDDE